MSGLPTSAIPGDPSPHQVLGRMVVRRGRKFAFETVSVRGPAGVPMDLDMVRHPGAATILPLLGDDDSPRVVMIRTHRFAPDRVLWELPAGTLEPGEDPQVAAGRELEEETGYAAATISPIGRFYTTPGLTDEVMHAFAARGLTAVGQRLEADESIVVHVLPASRVLEMLDAGEIPDAKTMLTLLLAVRQGLLGTGR